MAHDDKYGLTRREFVGVTVVTGGALVVGLPALEAQDESAERLRESAQNTVKYSLTINQKPYDLDLDPRVTLLDLLRENLHLTGTKKGCDHGQCGACTVLVNGRRINSCLSLAVSHDGAQVTTIDGLASGDNLHPVQASFLEHDGFQCGYCTPGQICSATAMLKEAQRGDLSLVSWETGKTSHPELSDAEIKERMAGNICRCGAYPNIVAAMRELAARGGAA